MSIRELKEIQNEIIRKNKKINTIFTVLAVIAIPITIILSNNTRLDFRMMAFFLFFELIFCFAVCAITKTVVNGRDMVKFREIFKNVFVVTALRKTFDEIEYNVNQGFSESDIDNYGFLDTADSFSSNDYISGKYKNISFEQSDLEIEERHETTDSDGHKTVTYIPIFVGRYMIFDFNKSFKANVQVASKNFCANRLPWGQKYSKVKMEDMEFNKLFSVYTSMEHDAFYLLTPHFIDKIKTLRNQLNSNMMLGFLDNRLHVAIDNGKDSFEWNVLKPIDEKEISDLITKDIKIITDFVDELNLDNDLFKKE